MLAMAARASGGLPPPGPGRALPQSLRESWFLAVENQREVVWAERRPRPALS